MTEEEEIKANAIFYEITPDRLKELSVKEINEIRMITNEVYDVYLGGINVVFVKGQPYKNLSELSNDYQKNDRIKVSRDFNNSRLFGRDCNLKFRAVHDYYHILLDEEFNYAGESSVYETQKTLYPEKYHKILYSEIVLQAAYFTYYNEFSNQKIVY